MTKEYRVQVAAWVLPEVKRKLELRATVERRRSVSQLIGVILEEALLGPPLIPTMIGTREAVESGLLRDETCQHGVPPSVPCRRCGR